VAFLNWSGIGELLISLSYTAAVPVIPFRVRQTDELSFRKRQRAGFRDRSRTDMVEMTVRRHDQIDALGRDRGAAQVGLGARERLPKDGPRISPKAGESTTMRSRPVSTTRMLFR